MTVILSHNDYRVVRVDPEQSYLIEEALIPLLQKSVPYTAGFETVEQLLDTLRQGMRPWQLWIVLKGHALCGGFITSLQRVSEDLVCAFELLAGSEAQEWIWPLVEQFERYVAFMYGATSMRIIGRRGWERFLRSRGYSASHFVTEKRLLQRPELAAPESVAFIPAVVDGRSS